MTPREKKIDEIDRQLFTLRRIALDLEEHELAELIGKARLKLYLLLPASRRREFL